MSDQRVEKTIYLDWNIFQDVIQSRKSDRLLEKLIAAKQKGFKIPYSHAHIDDLSRCSNDAYVKNDLLQIDSITEGALICKTEDGSDFLVVRVPSTRVYDANKGNKFAAPNLPAPKLEFSAYKADKSRLPQGNLFIPYLDRFGDFMCQDLLDLLISDLVANGLSDYKLQRGLRNSFAEVVNIGDPADKQIFDMPFYKYLFSTSEEIEENFLPILASFLGVTGKDLNAINEHEKFTTAYGILDFFPAFKEKIEKRNNINNMLTDALHVFIASKCSYFVGGDEKMLGKANLLYRIFGVKTRVRHVGDFISKVEF